MKGGTKTEGGSILISGLVETGADVLGLEVSRGSEGVPTAVDEPGSDARR